MLSARARSARQALLKERPPGIGRRRQRDQRRDPMEEIARLRRDVGDIARPHRDRQQHDVHRGKARDARDSISRRFASALRRLGPFGRERMAVIADVFQRLEDLAPARSAVVPGDVSRRLVKLSRASTTPAAFDRAFDLADAAAAGDALDRQRHMPSRPSRRLAKCERSSVSAIAVTQCKTKRFCERNSCLSPR